MPYIIMPINSLPRHRVTQSNPPSEKTLLKYTYLSVFLALFCLPAFAQERWQSDAYITQSFIKIALEREYKETKHPKLVRWEKPISVYVESDTGDSQLQLDLLTTQMGHLAYISGMPIHFTKQAKGAGILVIFTQYKNVEDKVRQYIGNPDKIRKALNEAVCLGNFRLNQRHEITRGTIIIPVDYAREKARLLDCVVEEITQLLGLPNDSDEVFPSVFNDHSIDTYLSPLDYILLKALYSPYLKPGMTVKQVKAAFPNVLKELHQSGDIEHALQRVQIHSLRRYVGD
ncbi:hypothetical protein MSP8886_02435 [Marinomonas spartinae]|uniref:DUF2927 domain-containing protein n=1 Tax=Marinomonas spartinae TaxID=1792290 RepID=A0A1A8TGW4_9GAMM|nr:DUF2927 domain-containing protein [Marinomonas spartinae]SBS32463.1 hypothetical protein MSP8886_02435 [Marinomonas spartinae]